uniref:phage tail protein n=1 Tax=Selenomonas sp. F0473 TaxID=999423 RepID=UPI0025EE337A
MGGIFGGGGTVSTADTRLGSIVISQSTYGIVIPVVFGTARLSGNMIDYMDFTAIPHTTRTRSGGKGGGGGVTTEHTTYTYEAATIFSLCEGPIRAVKRIWRDKKVYSNLTDMRMEAFLGGADQQPWAWMQGKYPERALSYPNTAYVASPNLELLSSGNTPTLNYEVAGRNIAPERDDAAPIDIIRGILCDAQIGVAFPEQYLADTTQFSNYCRAHGIYFSPAYDSQTESHELIAALLQAANSAPVWSQGKLKFVPYGLTECKANGVTYTPPVAPLYDITYDDLVYEEGSPPVVIKPNLAADRYNMQSVEILNRKNDYNVEPIKATDDADISQRGIRPADNIEMHFITLPDVAQFAAQAILQRKLYVVAQYEFTLTWRHCLLDPMDVVTITDPLLGLDHYPVRILSIEEDAELNLKITAEDCPDGVNSPTIYTTQAAERPKANYNIDPGSIRQPIVFPAPPALTASGYETWIAVCGESKYWGGCGVWASTDGDTYKRIGSISAAARMGVLIDDVAPEDHMMRVQLLGGDELRSGSADDMRALRTAVYINGEVMAYQAAQLTGTMRYELSPLLRGGYDTACKLHAAGSPFCRLDEAIFKYSYDQAQLGHTIYLKFTSFNIFGASEQSLADVKAYPYTLTCPLPPKVTDVKIDEDTYILKDGTVLSDILVAFQASVSPVLDHYNIYYDLNETGAWQYAGAAHDGSYRIKALPQAHKIAVQVTSFSKYGLESAGALSSVYEITGKSAPPPNVTGLKWTQNKYNREEIFLEWDEMKVQDVPDLHGYELRVGDESWDKSKRINRDAIWGNTYTYTAQMSGAYVFRLKSVDNSRNYSVLDTVLQAQIDVIPAAVSEIQTEQSKQDRSKLMISWQPSPGEDISRYIVRYGDTWEQGAVIAETKETVAEWSVPASGSYTIMVQAVTIAGHVSAVTSAAVLVSIEPPDVTGFAARQSDTNKTVVRLVWDTIQAPDIAYYVIKSGTDWETGEVIAPRVSGVYYDVIVTREQVQSWMIKAVTIAGNASQYAALLSEIFRLTPTPVSVIQCRQSAADKSILTMQWDPVPDGDLKGYEVRIGDKWDSAEALPLTHELYTTYTLKKSRSMRIMIKTINAAGYYSDETAITYSARIEPSNVTGLKAFQNGDTIELYWDAADEPDVVGYEIHEGSSWGNGQIVATGIPGTSHIIAIDSCRLYRYTIKAINKSGHYSILSSAVEITIKELMPKNIINSYDLLNAADGTHENTAFGASSINWQTIGGKWPDYPTVKFADVGGSNVLRLKQNGAGYARKGVYTCKTIDVGSVITANITTLFNNTLVLHDNGLLTLEVRTSQDGEVWIDWNIFKP